MGLCLQPETRSPQDIQEKATSKQQDEVLKDNKLADQQVNKLLLLGAGESGKSTLFKQLNTIYGKGMSEEERKNYVPVVHSNTVYCMQQLINASSTALGAAVACGDSLQFVKRLGADAPVEPFNVIHFKNLWRDPGIQHTYTNRSKFQINDSAAYFFDRLDQMSAANYMPSDMDVLRSRVRTLGIVESVFEIEGNKFRMFDVGGQRNERKKWIHCFENVTAVLFVGVLSEYDQMLFEDATVNRMVETLVLFEDACNSHWFKKTAIILFLNKRDLFEDKITRVPLNVCPVFAGIEGIQTYDAGVAAMEEAFQQRSGGRKIYSHVTCATDTTNVAAVFLAVKDITIRRALGDAGLV
jgi:energy-coupling factor transporter ATP-binding protein EcfA2